MKLIDKDTLVAEIERRVKDINMLSYPNNYDIAAIKLYEGLLSFINTLEVKEADLEKEYEKYYEQERNIQTFNLAKHFFELGLKAQKGE